MLKENKRLGKLLEEKHEEWLELMDEINNRETEALSLEWINEKAVEVYTDTADAEVHAVFRMSDLENLLVPKQEEVDRAYKDGYGKGKEHATEKEPETVASVMADFLGAAARLKEVLAMEVEELEE